MQKLIHVTLDTLEIGEQFAMHTPIAAGSIGVYEVVAKDEIFTCKRLDNPNQESVCFWRPHLRTVIIRSKE